MPHALTADFGATSQAKQHVYTDPSFFLQDRFDAIMDCYSRKARQSLTGRR
jgi:hypothetical protein